MKDGRKPRRRLMMLLGGVLLWSLVILARMVQVQVVLAEDLRELARRQHSSMVEIDPVRGSILDRNGVELALTRELKSVYAVPGLVADSDRAATLLARALKVNRRKLLGRLRLKDRNFVWVARKVSEADAAAVAALALPGIAFLEEPKRFYPKAGLAAHVLGYVGLDNAGMAGIEQQYDVDIRGIPGVKLTLRDARGVHFLPEPRGHPAEAGRHVVLTLDAGIQHALESALASAVADNQARGAVGVVLDPWTGDVLALASEPTFDPNDYGRAAPEVRRNRAVQEAYEPGSTFKVVTFAAALEQRRLDPDELIDCGHGSIQLNGARVSDHHPHDLITATEVLAQSSNVGAIRIGSRLRPDDFHRQMLRLGLGRPTGIDLPGEASGLLRPPSQWSGLSQPMLSFGYEVAVTPLQLASLFAAVANGGILVRPRLMLRVEEEDGRLTRASTAVSVRRALRPDSARRLTAMLEEVVRQGTGKTAAIEGLVVAGKTGTAKKLVGGAYQAGHYVASFCGFAPAAAPRAVVLVAIDEPRGGVYYGGQVSAPVVREVLAATLAILGVPSDGRVVERDLRDFYPAAPGASPPAGLAAARGRATPVAATAIAAR